MTELLVLTVFLGQDAFWLMDRIGDRTMDRMLARWLVLADEIGWQDIRCEECGAPRGFAVCGRKYN